MLNENLRKERIEKGLTQVELAKIFNVSKQTVSNWESGKRTPDAKTIEELADFYEVTVDHLLGRVTPGLIVIEPNKENDSSTLKFLNKIRFKTDLANNKFSNEDLENFRKYSELSDNGKQIINLMIEELYSKKEK